MNTISKVSEITAADLAEYMRLDDYSDDVNTLNNMLSVAKSFICQWTGQKAEDLDDFNDFVIVVFVLVQDMWDNRTLYIDKTGLNKVVESILGLHQVNLL